MKEHIAAFVDGFDKLFGVLYKYELHAFVLVVTGLSLCLHGMKEEGMGLMMTGCTIFKGKATS